MSALFSGFAGLGLAVSVKKAQLKKDGAREKTKESTVASTAAERKVKPEDRGGGVGRPVRQWRDESL
jgi:hypothetical protein